MNIYCHITAVLDSVAEQDRRKIIGSLFSVLKLTVKKAEAPQVRWVRLKEGSGECDTEDPQLGVGQ